MDKNIINCPQWKKRVRAMQFIYSQLILDDSCEIAKKIAYQDYLVIGADFLNLLEYFVSNKRQIINEIEKYLDKKWNFDRLNTNLQKMTNL